MLGKGLSPGTQSILFFGACQVAIDLEPAIKMLMGYTGSLHSITHNFFGAMCLKHRSSSERSLI